MTVSRVILPLGFIFLALVGFTPQGCPNRVEVEFNQKFIEGVSSRLNLQDPMAVFQAVFARLDEEVVVYPTENYYYFQIHASGKTIWGNLRLDASDRDQGIIHLGYFEYDENGNYQDREGHEKDLSSRDGVLVRRLAPLIYSVTYKDKRVIFKLNDLGQDRPSEDQMGENEAFVGPIFDESGLKFFLFFDKTEKHFFYVLNEHGYIPESFISLGQDLVLGRRTGFAFFQDNDHHRKILVGVHGRSVDRNNWYDGPFDQLPDNYVKTTRIKEYLEEAYPFVKGSIDKFGGYLNQKGTRVPIFAYTVYYDLEELTNLIKTCKAQHPGHSGFYACITPDPYQLIESPKGRE